MPRRPKIVLLATGGTIASRYDAALGRTVASQRADDLLKMLPGAADVAELEIDDFATIPSFDMTAPFAFEMCGRIRAHAERPDVHGVVVTHGTDTMEETSYLADLLHRSDKPVVFTGAQRAHDDPQADGPLNLLNSLRAAAATQTRGLGVMLGFNGLLHAARDVTKMHTSAVETFQSPERGALGEVDGDHVVIHRRPALRRTFVVDALEHRVHLFRLSLGVDLAPLEWAVDRGMAGLVIEGFGRGNGPSALTALVRRAVDRGIAVVVTSRCAIGRVQPVYGGGGGGRDLADAGAIFSGDLKGPKARLLLMVLLSDRAPRERIAETFAALAP